MTVLAVEALGSVAKALELVTVAEVVCVSTANQVFSRDEKNY